MIFDILLSDLSQNEDIQATIYNSDESIIEFSPFLEANEQKIIPLIDRIILDT